MKGVLEARREAWACLWVMVLMAGEGGVVQAFSFSFFLF